VNIWYFHPYAGGPGVGRTWRPYYLGVEWRKLGHRCTVFAARNHHLLDRPAALDEEREIDGVRYVGLPARAYQGNGLGRILNMLDYCRGMRKLAARIGKDLEKPDAIIISSPHPFGIVPGRSLARKFGAKLVFEVRDLWPLSITEINGTSRWHPFVLLTAVIERFAYRNSHLVASLLYGVEEYMKERNLAYRRFIWVPNGIAMSQPSPAPALTEQGSALASQIDSWHAAGKLVLMHPGGMGPPNGLITLVEALRLLRSSHLSTRLCALLVGEGSQRGQIEAFVKEHDLSTIIIGNPLPKSDADSLLEKCDLGYVGSSANDGLYRYGVSPNKALDYIRSGKPFVCTLGNVGQSFAQYPLVIHSPPNDSEALATALWDFENKGMAGSSSAAASRLAFSRVAADYLAAMQR
jgi:glycosyltransferase involved in cell wall biosynthesis